MSEPKWADLRPADLWRALYGNKSREEVMAEIDAAIEAFYAPNGPSRIDRATNPWWVNKK